MESEIKENRGKNGDNFETVGHEETVGQADLFKPFEQEDLEIVGQEDSSPPVQPSPPRRSQQKAVLLHVMS